MKIILQDKHGKEIEVAELDHSDSVTKAAVVELYTRGYPDSFDEYDLEQIKKDLEAGTPCLVARRSGRVIGALQFVEWPAIQAGWLFSYLFVRKKEQGSGIGKILFAVAEETLKKEARIIFTTHGGVLPDYVSSYGFFPSIGYLEWGSCLDISGTISGESFLSKETPITR